MSDLQRHFLAMSESTYEHMLEADDTLLHGELIKNTQQETNAGNVFSNFFFHYKKCHTDNFLIFLFIAEPGEAHSELPKRLVYRRLGQRGGEQHWNGGRLMQSAAVL